MQHEQTAILPSGARSRGLASRRGPQADGFTLIELVLTIAVVGILGSLAVSAYNGYVVESRIGRAILEIRNIELVVSDYASDTGVFPATLADVGADSMRDPWGNPYQYLNIANAPKGGLGKLRKDKSLVPINSDFDLYSMGPNGDSVGPLTAKKSRDDIVRANNGKFIGLAEDY